MQKNKFVKNGSGFTLLELLIVLAIIGLLASISIFGLQGAREGARDSRRKTDLETIRSGLELFRSDCGDYPSTITFGGILRGDNSSPRCPSSNIYIQLVPNDPTTGVSYRYYSPAGNARYEICADLEQGTGTQSCNGTSCGSGTCNYKVTSP